MRLRAVAWRASDVWRTEWVCQLDPAHTELRLSTAESVFGLPHGCTLHRASGIEVDHKSWSHCTNQRLSTHESVCAERKRIL